MDETKNLSETEGSESHAGCSSGSVALTTSLSRTEPAQLPVESSCGSVDQTVSLSRTEGRRRLLRVRVAPRVRQRASLER